MHIIYLYSFHFQNSGPLITVYEKSPWVSVSNEGLGNLSSHPCPSPFFITEIVNKQVDELELDSPLNTRHLKITLKENIFTNLRESMQFYFTVLGVYFFPANTEYFETQIFSQIPVKLVVVIRSAEHYLHCTEQGDIQKQRW